MSRLVTTLSICCYLFSTARGQNLENQVLLRAMKDEMQRSMQELQLEGYQKPFFIQYGINESKNFFAVGVLGALVQSGDHLSRAKNSVRVLVGGYEFNDESLDNNLFSTPQANEIDLPLDDDYLGVRRSMWITTDNVYRNAAQQFKKNQEMLAETKKNLSDISHRSFASAPAVTMIIEANPYSFSREAYENYVREVSGVFKNYPEIRNSQVSMSFVRGYRYIVNTEGSLIKTPTSIAMLRMGAQSFTASGELVFDQRTEYGKTPDQLPTLDKAKEMAKGIAESVLNSGKTPVFKDNYMGPILLEGPAVAEVVARMMSGREGFALNNNITPLQGLQFSEGPQLESKIGKMIMATGINIKATPKLKKYGQHELMGSFDVDDEGIMPKDETIIVENGVLKELFNDRTITGKNQTANGLGAGPGVVSFTFTPTLSKDQLKAKLIQAAKSEGLDYAIVVRASGLSMSGLVSIYQVSTATGEEKLLRMAVLKAPSISGFRRVLGASSEMVVHEMPTGFSELQSFIVPSAILLENAEVGESMMPTIIDREYVSNPLKSKK